MDSYLQPNENAYTNAEKRLRNFEQKRRALMINIEDAKKTQYAAFVKRMRKKGYQVGPDGEVISATGKFLGNFEDGVQEVKKIEKEEVKEDPQDKVLFGEDLMSRYGPGGKDNDPSDNYDADKDTTDAVAARQQSFDPNYTDLADDVSAQPTSAGTNKTSTRDKLKSRAVGPAGISDRNTPKGYIRTEGKLQSVKSVKGQRAKMRLDRLRKLQMRIKAGK